MNTSRTQGSEESGIFTWYWLADLCAAEGIAFVHGVGPENPNRLKCLTSAPVVIILE